MRIYRYLVLFTPSEDGLTNSPIVFSDLEKLKKENKGTMHQLDRDIYNVLPIIEYCLHLPRNETDVCDTEPHILNASHDTCQDIILAPYTLFSDEATLSQFDIVFCDEGCYLEIKEKAKRINVECVSENELADELLVKHWKMLYNLRINKKEKCVPDIDVQHILTGNKIIFLPCVFLARQLGKAKEIYEYIDDSVKVFEDCANTIFIQEAEMYAFSKCQNVKSELEFSKKFYGAFEEGKRMAMINTVVTFPGAAPRQIKHGGLSSSLSHLEKRAIRIIGVHRAIAKHALLIELPIAKEKLFKKIDDLEIACKNCDAPNNQFIHKTLKDYSSLIESLLSKPKLWAIKRSKQITVFSNLPFCLFIPSGYDTPLIGQKELSSRPLTPLTRCMQFEMPKHSQYYLGEECRVMFVECVPNIKENRLIRRCSSVIVDGLERASDTSKKISYQTFEAYNINDLKSILVNNSKNFDILLISAHGFYDRARNVSGLVIGNEKWLANSNDYHTPPVVILSACHVSPRGGGVISAADLFLRNGAEAILSTFVPINSFRNALLINRFFYYIAEAQLKRMRFKTIADAWSRVVASNAILEIAEQSNRLRNWVNGKNKNGITRFEDFAFNRSKGRLKVGTAYNDTIVILKEMLDEEGRSNLFSDTLSNGNYFPESFFYQWIGFPENVFLYNEIFAKMIEIDNNFFKKKSVPFL